MTFIQAAHHSSGSNLPPTRVVIHATCPEMGFPKASAKGRAVSTARYFQSASSGGSAHYVVDIGETVQCLGENVIAWHAPPNAHSLGIEICADGGSATSFSNPKVRYTRAQWLSPQVWPAVLRAAALTRKMCSKYGIPVVKLSASDLKAGKKGICGHVDVSNAFHQSDHDDPGPDFPWAEFMAAVKGGTTTQEDEDEMKEADWQRMERLVDARLKYAGIAKNDDPVFKPDKSSSWPWRTALWSISYYATHSYNTICNIARKLGAEVSK
ncbi:N-acetylmuramoyl-L-alanine amidase [Acidipropionibacterium acidipropionici]|nr:peptidoglycan recognition family protein [Acidipropionibacterium acidipropionici]AZP38765.1 N-acetylmuramoyl-L-alanine amidase [Acidipropionibacterium acidipropionici]